MGSRPVIRTGVCLTVTHASEEGAPTDCLMDLSGKSTANRRRSSGRRGTGGGPAQVVARADPSLRRRGRCHLDGLDDPRADGDCGAHASRAAPRPPQRWVKVSADSASRACAPADQQPGARPQAATAARGRQATPRRSAAGASRERVRSGSVRRRHEQGPPGRCRSGPGAGGRLALEQRADDRSTAIRSVESATRRGRAAPAHRRTGTGGAGDRDLGPHMRACDLAGAAQARARAPRQGTSRGCLEPWPRRRLVARDGDLGVAEGRGTSASVGGDAPAGGSVLPGRSRRGQGTRLIDTAREPAPNRVATTSGACLPGRPARAPGVREGQRESLTRRACVAQT